jgi:hypothetical protein
MKKNSFLLLLTFLTPAITLAAQKSLHCVLAGMQERLSFELPTKAGKLPEIDFPYPVSTTIFSLRSDNLLLVVMDKDEPSRPRIFLSAQYHKALQRYEGQFMTDFGGNQIQLDNGSLSCKVE